MSRQDNSHGKLEDDTVNEHTLTEEAITVYEVAPAVVQITLQDRVNKNTFSNVFMEGVIKAFADVSTDPRYKVVIITGYDTYFASGGTQESLLALSDGKGKFTDVNLYSLALDCEIPVISAMQGHGIGGGFVMGLFADFVILSRESVYTTNFMRYGFTPGMGATYIVPKKLGMGLAHEMLLNGANYRGLELEKRGVPFPVVARDEVLPRAYELAAELSEKPRVSLVTLKSHLVRTLREELDGVIQQEVAMHDKTFHQPEVRERIAKLFGK